MTAPMLQDQPVQPSESTSPDGVDAAPQRAVTALSHPHRDLVPIWPWLGARLVDACAWSVGLMRPDSYANPHVPVSAQDVRSELVRLRINPVSLRRRVLILNGYHGWSGLAYSVRDVLCNLTSQRLADFLVVSYASMGDFFRIARFVLEQVAAAKHPDAWDVVGISMGGVLARWCSLDASTQTAIEASCMRAGAVRRVQPRRVADSQPNTFCQLHINTLLTFASPHRRAVLADRIAPDPAGKLLRSDSPLLAALNDPDAMKAASIRQLRCYTQLRDRWVGESNTAPPGQQPCWVAGPPLFSHFSVAHHPLLLADAARVLRCESPLLPPAAFNCVPT